MDPMIQVENLCKSFSTKNGTVEAARNISFSIEKGEIFGIIGLSGAGKSTLVRCLNLLERPTSGTVRVNGKNLTKLSEKELRKERQNIGMIFQHFNLLMQRTALDNVCFPMEIAGISKKEARKKALEYLKVVGLEEKALSYPSQLSGGQKQRVAIARVLASDPKILLCDEATSALDPQTTKAILELIKEINRDYGITVVVITHEMSVIKSIANRVAVMENGKVVEEGDVYDIFANPKEEITKKFINSSSSLSNITKLIENKTIIPTDCKLVKLTFTRDSVGSATISKISREYNVDVNIMLANVDVVNADALGGIIASIEGTKENVQRAIDFLHESNVKVEVIHHA